MFDVITIGSATLDVFVRSKGLEIEKEDGTKEICVPYGAKLEVDEIYFETGGGGTNTAVTFARQGLKVACLVQLGDDLAGREVLAVLKKEGVDTSLVVAEKGENTDYSTILWAPDGGRTILVSRGKTRLETKDVSWEKLKTKWFYISSVEGNLKIIKKVQGCKGFKGLTKIAWNPGRKELAQREELLELLPGIEVLNLNKEEMARLLGIKAIEEIKGIKGIKGLLRKAQKLPCRYVVVTCGEVGSYLWDGEKWLQAGVYDDNHRYEATGAGDSFGSGLVTGMIKGLSLEGCLCLATANASSVVTKVGAKRGILHENEVEKWVKKKLVIRTI